jgi:hypothetical protein
MDDERQPVDDESVVSSQERAAAAEAGKIGGPAPDYDVPEAERPIAEGGGGEAEGFEQAEELLEQHASHGEPGPDPTHLAGEPEEPEARDAEHGEADDVDSTEDDEAPG